MSGDINLCQRKRKDAQQDKKNRIIDKGPKIIKKSITLKNEVKKYMLNMESFIRPYYLYRPYQPRDKPFCNRKCKRGQSLLKI